MCCSSTVTKMTMDTSSDAAVVAEDLHTELLSGSVPLEENVTKLTFVPATCSLIHIWNSDTRAYTSGNPAVAQGTPKLVIPTCIQFEPCWHCKGPPESPYAGKDKTQSVTLYSCKKTEYYSNIITANIKKKSKVCIMFGCVEDIKTFLPDKFLCLFPLHKSFGQWSVLH